MPISTPVAASGSRSPAERSRRIPQPVRAACVMMVEEAVDFVAAAKANNLRPDTMRRWLHRPEVISFLRRERAAFRQAVCAPNEAVLAQIRDNKEGNQMARVHAIKTLEQLEEEASARRGSIDRPSPGVVIHIVHNTPATLPPNSERQGTIIEHTVAPPIEVTPERTVPSKEAD
jgi:hypothetical protein